MCGLVGVFGDPHFRMYKVFKDLLQIDVLRGADSTGYAVFGRKHKFIDKDIFVPQYLIYTKTFDENVTKKQGIISCYLGHNRAATKGSVTKENAHPFRHGAITGIHNGTLTTDIKANNKTFNTDSEGIMYGISTHGIDWTWKNLHGAASIAYWDNNDKTLNIVSNGRRPLFFAYAEKKKLVIVGSDQWMIRFSAMRNNVTLDDNQVWKPKDDELFTFSLNKAAEVVEKTRKLKNAYSDYQIGHGKIGFRNPNYNCYGYGYGHEDYEWPDDKKEEKNTTLIVKRNPQGNLIPFQQSGGKQENKNEERVTDKVISKEEFQKWFTNCVFCKEPLADEYESSVILDSRNAACEQCASDAAMNGMPLKALIGA